MRSILLLLSVTLAVDAAGQAPTPADSGRRAAYDRELRPGHTVKLFLPDHPDLTGRVGGRQPDSLLVWQGRNLVSVPLDRIADAWVRRSSSGRLAAVGGALGGVGLGTLMALAAVAANQEGGGGAGNFVGALVIGFTVGGAIGGGIGAIVGATDSQWCPVGFSPTGRTTGRRPCGVR